MVQFGPSTNELLKIIRDKSIEELNANILNLTISNGPLYLGVVRRGVLKYDGSTLPLPLRPWRSDNNWSIIATDAGTSTNVSFVSATKEINITTDTFEPLILRTGDTITVSGSSSNNGTFTVVSFTPSQIIVSEAVTNESAAATVTITAPGDIPAQVGTNLAGYSFGDTEDNPLKDLRWHHFLDVFDGVPKQILICDRNIIGNVSWNHINNSDFVAGKTVTIDGQTAMCRILSGGSLARNGVSSSSYTGGFLPNEFDRYIMNGTDQDWGVFFDGAPTPASTDFDINQHLSIAARRRAHNQAWNWWNMYSWCQTIAAHDSARRVLCGNQSARYWNTFLSATAAVQIGFRPCMVI